MKVLAEQAVADPSRMEKKVMEQVNQRLSAHEMRNLARRLTPQEKKEKARRKTALACWNVKGSVVRQTASRFYVASLESSQHRYKIDVNAKQLALTGGVLICSSVEAPINLVLVEGGPKAVKKFSGLLTRRIDWADQTESKTPRATPNWCALVWRGTVVKRAFAAFRFQECKTAATARRVMEAKGVAHYWDMVRLSHEGGPPPENA
ncbi:hypothetical protein M885DRAFT_491124 [Pelagophyceae sp. CCMP2097]|nr:hypothetical protein M885DRAFT_491124 [Pelagophyceae sp. CCMP2097]